MDQRQHTIMSERRRRFILLIVSITAFLTAFMASSVNIALPSISVELSIGPVAAGWIVTSYILSAVVFILFFGRMGDVRGRRLIFSSGIFIIILSSIGCVLAPGGIALILCRVIQGIGASTLFATATPILATAYPPQKRGRVLGISVASVYLGVSMGPFIGGFLTHYLGWRSIFFFLIIGFSLIVFPALRTITDPPRERERVKFDIAGNILYACAVVCGVVGLSRIIRPDGVVLCAVAICVSILFFAHEFRTDAPLVPVRLFYRNKVFVFSNIAAMINYSATFAIAFFMSLYLQYAAGYTAQKAGMVLMVQPLMQAVFSPCAGKLSDTKDPRVLASTGMGLVALSLAVIAFFPGVLHVEMVVVALGALGIGFAFFSSPNNNAVLGSVEQRHVGIASSILSTMRLIGQSFSMAIAIFLLSHFMGPETTGKVPVPAFLLAFRSAFAIFAVLCVIGIFASLSRGKLNR
jgi:EmrB/QacA subfamily drug resistance transporter